MACTELTRCDNSLTAAPHSIALDDGTGLVDYDGCKIDGIGLGNLPNSTSTAENLCKRLRGIKALRGNRKWKNKAQRNENDKLDNVEKKLCDKLKEIYAEPESSNSGSPEEVEKEPETIYGCLDPTATNYYCKENDCVDNKPPKGIQGTFCHYSRELSVENKYLFCNGKYGCFGEEDTTEEGWISPTTDIAKWINNGAIENDHIYDVKKGVKDLIKNIKPTGIFLKNQKGFYARKFSEQLINEFANALTVAIFKTKFKKDSDRTFPFTRLTVYGGDSQPLGQFSIIPTTDKNGEVDSISSIKMHDSSRTLNARLRDEIGTEILDPNHETGMIKLFGPGGKFEDVRFTIKDGKIINEQVKEGLGLVLQEEPIGLSKLIK